jgi:hypothetical protein
MDLGTTKGARQDKKLLQLGQARISCKNGSRSINRRYDDSCFIGVAEESLEAALVFISTRRPAQLHVQIRKPFPTLLNSNKIHHIHSGENSLSYLSNIQDSVNQSQQLIKLALVKSEVAIFQQVPQLLGRTRDVI